jgi:hypothetical protein
MILVLFQLHQCSVELMQHLASHHPGHLIVQDQFRQGPRAPGFLLIPAIKEGQFLTLSPIKKKIFRHLHHLCPAFDQVVSNF